MSDRTLYGERGSYLYFGSKVFLNGKEMIDREDSYPFGTTEAHSIPFDMFHAVLGNSEYYRVCVLGVSSVYVIFVAPRSEAQVTIRDSLILHEENTYTVVKYDVSQLPVGNSATIVTRIGNIIVYRVKEDMIDVMYEIENVMTHDNERWTATIGYEYGSGWDGQEADHAD